MKTYTITINIPDHLQVVFDNKVKALMDRGFSLSEASDWAALYIREYPMQTEETSEKVIELFGTNLFHMPKNVRHLADKLRDYMPSRAEQFLNAVKYKSLDAPAETEKKPIYITKYKDLKEGSFGAFSYFHTVQFNTPDAWSYSFNATDEGMGSMVNRLQKGGYDVIFNTK